MKHLYVLGGEQRYDRSLFERGYWYNYHKARILEVNPNTGDVIQRNEYVSPPEASAPKDPEVLYKSGTVQDNRLYVCTQTEVMVYELPSFERVAYISLPSFNDVHHVRPLHNGTILVANSGLDMVMELTLDGRVVREWNVLGEDPWARFSRDIDYRKGINLKPHRAHPNNVFTVGDELWATRFQQKDAISLTNPNRRIDIGIERVHDGYYHEGLLYFTTVNGFIVVANPVTLAIEEMVDLNAMHSRDMLLGWCRGIYIDNGKVWVGFSTIRPTKSRENIAWVARGFRHVRRTHIACYDLRQRRCLQEVELVPHGLSAVFSVLPCEHTHSPDVIFPHVDAPMLNNHL